MRVKARRSPQGMACPCQGLQHGRRLRWQGFFRFAETAMPLRLPCIGAHAGLP